MANVLVYTELEGGRPTRTSLSALGQARRLASAVGATVYAVLPCAQVPSYGDDDTIAILGRHGADKIVLLTAAPLAKPSLFATHGPAVLAACEQLPPAMLLFPASAGGCDIAPRVATRLGAAYAHRPRIDIEGEGVVLARDIYGGAWECRLAIDELERPVVATWEGPVGEPGAECDAEVVVIQPPVLREAVDEISDPKAAAGAPACAARVLLLADGEVPADLKGRLLAAGVVVVRSEIAPEPPPGGVAVAAPKGDIAAFAQSLLQRLGNA
jgi:electron transfer flavoprotein alpha subunit